MSIKSKSKKLILEFYQQPQKYVDFITMLFDLHEELINNQELVVKDTNVFKTNILGNETEP